MCETKKIVDNVVSRLSVLNPSSSFGFDSDGSKGDLAVLGWTNVDVNCIHAYKNVVVCNLLERNGKSRQVIFVYREPKVEDRR